MKSVFGAIGLMAFVASPVAAQQAAPKPAATATKAAKPAAAPRSAQSIECSKQADAKGLHGKARKTFRSQCKSGGQKGK